MKDNLIENNNASMIGGGLYLIFSSESNSIYQIENNQFISNKANIAASIYFNKITHINFTNNTFKSNKA